MNQNCIIEHGIDGNCEMKKHLKIVNTKHPRTFFYLIAISCISNIKSKSMTMQRLGKQTMKIASNKSQNDIFTICISSTCNIMLLFN